MLTRLVFFLQFIFIAFRASAQQDTSDVQKMMQLAKDYLYVDAGKSLGYAYDALSLAKELGNLRWEGKALSLCGLYNIYEGEHSLGKETLEIAFSKLEISGILPDILEVRTHIGAYYSVISNYDTAIKILSGVINQAQQVKNIDAEEYARNFISLAYLQAGYYENGIRNGLRLLQLKDMLGKSKVDTYTEIADIYAHRKDLPKAHEYYTLALEECIRKENEPASLAFCYQNYGEILVKMDSLDKAYKLFEKALKYIEVGDHIEEKALIYLNLGNCLLKQKKYQHAKDYFLLCEKISSNKTSPRFPVQARAGLVKVFYELGQDSLCTQMGKAVILEAQKLREKPLILDLSLLLSEAHKRLKQFDVSLNYLFMHINYGDSLFWIQKETSIRDMQIKYEVEITEAENQKLTIENQLNESRFYNTLVVVFFLIVLLLLILGVLLRFRSLNIKLDLQNKIISSQYDDLLRLDKEKNFILSFITHDLRNLLQRIFGYIYIVREYGGLQEQEQFKKVFAGLQATEHEIKSLVNNTLDSQMLEEGKIVINKTQTNIVEILNLLIDNLNYRASQKNIKLDFYYNENRIFAYSDEIVLERILDNLISNAIKFSPFGSVVSVSVHNEDQEVKVWIQDQGPGFNQEDLKNMFQKFSKLSARPTDDEVSTGLGLSIVKSMSEKLDIKLNYGNLNPVGAFFSLSIPKS